MPTGRGFGGPGGPGGGNAFQRIRSTVRGNAQGAISSPPAPPTAEELADAAALRDDIKALIDAMRATQLHTMPPAYIEPPFRSKGFDDFGTVTAGAASAFQTIVTVRIQRNFFGVIRGWGQDLDDLTGFDGDTTWRILVNGAAVRPYDLVTRQLGTVLNPRSCMIPVQAGEVAQLQVANAGAGAYEATGYLKGWVWPAKLTGSTGGFADTLTD